MNSFNRDLLSFELSEQHYLTQGIKHIYNTSYRYIEEYNIDILLDIYSRDSMKCLILNSYKQANFVPEIVLSDYGCAD
jgi:hypothetical protein